MMKCVEDRPHIPSLPIDMLLSAVSVLVVAQSSSEIPEGLMNNPVFNIISRPVHLTVVTVEEKKY
jgi:hypothetical protein